MAREAGSQRQGRDSAFHESELKICELCGWLNLETNAECFVCGWHGRFVHDPDVVHAAMELAVRRYGRLELQHLTDSRLYRQAAPPTWRSRFRAFARRIWSWLRG